MRDLLQAWGSVLRRVIGAPDYDAYLAHVKAAHDGAAVMSREEFVASRLRDRYERPGSKCC